METLFDYLIASAAKKFADLSFTEDYGKISSFLGGCESGVNLEHSTMKVKTGTEVSPSDTEHEPKRIMQMRNTFSTQRKNERKEK